MTYEQAIDEFEKALEFCKKVHDEDLDLDYCEALKLGIKAMEKIGVGKEIITIQTTKFGEQCACPVCRSLLLTSYYSDHCKYCGQKLKWGDEE
jgi:hypothetical protein